MSTSRKKRKKRRIIIFTLEIILLLAVLAALYVWSKLQKINREPDFIGTEDYINTDIDEGVQETLKGYTNIALFGLDNRSNGNFDSGNSDVIMIASINNDTKEVKLVSVYRDTYLNMSENSYQFRKANYAFNKGGAEEAVKMLNRNLDLDIGKYVVVDFRAVTEAIDLLGGVEIEITEKEAKWMNFYIKETAQVTNHEAKPIDTAGVYQMDGVQATSYCRIRYTAGDDFRRSQRQREVISKMVDKAKNAGILTINEIIDTVTDHVSTNFTNAELLSLASQLLDYELTDTTGFPFKLTTKTMSGSTGSVVVPCDLVTNASELHRYLFNEENYTPSNTVSSFSAEITAETGLGIGDEVDTGVEADNNAGSSQTQSGAEEDADSGAGNEGSAAE